MIPSDLQKSSFDSGSFEDRSLIALVSQLQPSIPPSGKPTHENKLSNAYDVVTSSSDRDLEILSEVGEVFPSITKFRARLRLTMHKVAWRGATGKPSVGIRIWNVWGWCDVDPASGGYCTGARGAWRAFGW
jgi:hypothetical protein